MPSGYELYGISVFHDESIITESVTSYTILTEKTENNQNDNLFEKIPNI